MGISVKNRAVILAFRLLASLPHLFVRGIARFLAAIVWLSGSEMRKVTEVNLALCYPNMPEAERQQLAKQAVLETVRTVFEMPHAWLSPAQIALQKIHQVQGLEYIEQLRSEGNGVIIILPHMGNWEYIGLYLAQRFPCTSLYKPTKEPEFNAIVRDARSRTGAELVPTNKKGVLAVVKALKAGGITCILPDQIPDDKNSMVFAPFFGEQAATMTLIPNLLQRGNIKAVCGFAKRREQGGFDIVIQPVDEAIYSEDTATAAAAMNRSMEQLVALAPAQYQWEYKRFRLGPQGKRNCYKRQLI